MKSTEISQLLAQLSAKKALTRLFQIAHKKHRTGLCYQSYCELIAEKMKIKKQLRIMKSFK
jgi:hypothetical protein